jgi:hypothetical protein
MPEMWKRGKGMGGAWGMMNKKKKKEGPKRPLPKSA